MWILESDGEFLQGKRVWLRPGQRYLFGRVKKDGVSRALDHKGVSRRQCVIEVGNVKPGDGSLLHTRSKLTVTDENSKGGTQVDGHTLKGTSQELKDVEHRLKLGSYPHLLVIKWEPVCLSFFLTSKEKKSNDPLGAKRAVLEPLDIKVIQPFVYKETTHVVATKRNTVPGLQALITGRHIVDHSFIDALVFAATPEDLEEEENVSPLEKDFDAAWPDPRRHIPPKGREPTSKPVEAYAPDATREHIFEGWTFVFLESGQYETILPAITTGHGKALLHQLEPGRTTVDDVVTFMQNVGNRKDSGVSSQRTGSGDVILVKPALKGKAAQPLEELVEVVVSRLDQKAIDQANFLDAILSSDGTLLKQLTQPKPPSREMASASATGKAAPNALNGARLLNESPVSSATVKAPSQEFVPSQTQNKRAAHDDGISGNQDDQRPPESGNPEHGAPPKKRPRTRAAPVSRFKQFVDDFDMDAVTHYEPPDEETETPALSTPEIRVSPAPLEAVQLDNEADIKPTSDSTLEGYLPATTALAKRRAEIERGIQGRESRAEQSHVSDGRQFRSRKASPEKKIDIRQAARERREAEEEAACQDRQALEAQLADISVEEMKNLAVVEEMEVPTRKDGPARSRMDLTDRWDDRWNGRKNFKRFRRNREAGAGLRGETQKVIVPLVEVKRKTYGIGDAYWSSSRHQETEDRDSDNRHALLQSQSQIRSLTSPEDSATPAMTRLQQEAADVVVEAIGVNGGRQTRSSNNTRPSQQSTMSSGRAGKRSATSTSRSAPKRQRTIATKATSESESDEGLRFKFR